ncbi:MAG: hypothetical protein V2B14_07050 [bacterium]
MQAIDISSELSLAINSVESLLNEKDGEFVLEVIKKYKKHKNLDSYTLNELKHRLNK